MIRIMETTGITPGEPDYSPEKRRRWLDERRSRGGGSDTASLFGLTVSTAGDILRTPYDVWLDKSGLAEDFEPEPNSPPYHGTRLESYVAQQFAALSGIGVIEDHWLLAHDEHERIAANVDYYTDDGGVLECTTSRVQSFKQWPDGLYFRRKHVQLQQYLGVTDRPHGYIACLFGGQRLEFVRVERDEEAWHLIVAAWEEFWPHVESGIPPDLWPETPKRAVALGHPIFSTETVELPHEAAMWVQQHERAKRRLKRVNKIVKAAEAKRDEAEARLIRILDGKAEGAVFTDDGYRRVAQTEIERKAYSVEETTYRQLQVQAIKPKE